MIESSVPWWRDPVPLGAIFTGVLAIAAIIQILVYLRQANLMKKSLRITKDAADNSKRATELCEMADLQLEKYHLAPFQKVDANTIFCVTYKNYGRTTAKDIKVSLCFRNHPFRVGPCVSAKNIVAPGEQGFFERALSALNSQMTFADYERINGILKELWFTVLIDFADVFNNKHWIEYELRFDTEKRGFPDYLVRSSRDQS